MAQARREGEERVVREGREERERRERAYVELGEGGSRSNAEGWDEEEFM